MQSSSSRRFLVVRRGVAATTLTAMVVVVGAAGAADRTQAADEPPARMTSGVVEARAVRTPPPPQRLTASGLRPLDRVEADRLRGGNVSRAVSCEIDFDDDAAIALLPNGALDTFAYSPWWNQSCSGFYARVYPTDTDHLHLGYADDTIGVCINADNPHDTPVGVFSRGEDCEPIDPVTEPRSYITVGHYPTLHGRLDLIDSHGSDYTPQAFTLERIRILWAPARVCYRMSPDGPWIAAAPVGPFDEPGLVYCWASLDPGWWDLSDWTAGTVSVDFVGTGDSLPGYDDIRLG